MALTDRQIDGSDGGCRGIHGPHLDRPICLIVNERIQAVSELRSPHATTGPRQSPPRAAADAKEPLPD
ncbi:hypothetical protein FQA47_025701 [Oryzias melastigma]|uniref:Uncharacterized protein n=1 Tax=Oryzias melastigma TaxID=30732 RepID=A0A834CKC4_ORYME|nr:hypothetical protein FQA47_025701 [Oryzias melastigma]